MNLAVQHCNRRTGYDIVVHDFSPDDCDGCQELIDICGGDIEVTKNEIDLINRDRGNLKWTV